MKHTFFSSGQFARATALVFAGLAFSTVAMDSEARPLRNCSITPPSSDIIEGESVQFSGRWRGGDRPFIADWTFPDGSAQTSGRRRSSTVSHAFTSAGPKQVAMQVTDDNGDSCNATASVNVQPGGGSNNAPVCTIDTPAGAVNVTVGGAVNYTGTVTDPDVGDSVTIAWDFPGGEPASSDLENPGDVTYNTMGIFTTTLVATDNDGASCEQQTRTITVEDAPQPIPPTASANGPYAGFTGVAISFSSAGSIDPDGNIVSYAWNFGDGGSSSEANPSHIYTTADTYTVTLTVTDNAGDSGSDETTAVVSNQVGLPDVSINSTSQNGIPGLPVSEQAFTGLSGYKLFSANDLGMHCGDLDTRISSVLPPFQVVHTQVIQRGSEPHILTPTDGIEVVYSASSNPDDPILTGINSAGTGPVLSSLLPDSSVYKTNFWDIARDAYDPFYPKGILPAFYPAGATILDQGLPMPNVEQLFLGDGNLTAVQQEMPGRFGPYAYNDPMVFKLFTTDQPFFTSFPFGYTAEGVNWFEAAGIPLTAFDDYGRENPWPLMRVQARSGGQVLASLDTVLPISGEANCGFCHNAPIDGGNGAATAGLSTVALSVDDMANVPMEVSLEWAADINLLRLHDQNHGTNLIVGTTQDDPPGSIPFEAVVCQSCHYTPALDLAQLGPLGPENDGPLILNGVQVSESLANGRDQFKNKSMSNVMHSHHATVKDLNGDLLFPTMPPPVDNNGNLRDPGTGRQVMDETCYQCHPGRRTDCLRGAMASGGMLCQDCHGDMAQVGDDFTRNVSPTNAGAFELASDFYTNPATPRVPWANEPGCGSCHTGDAVDNMHGAAGTIGDPQDGIRLMQAYLTTDAKATPIVPTNKRFAENVVETGPATGNPMLYRVSKGHEGVFCEACHGSTHGIWPNKNPNANDNVAAMQLQGHTGTITECGTCHADADLGLSLGGPHGMHQVSQISGNGTAIDTGSVITTWNSDHKELDNFSSCRSCHGVNGEGTVLSRTAADRTLECKEDSAPGCTKVDINGEEERRVLVAKGTEISCVLCHDNKINEGGGD